LDIHRLVQAVRDRLVGQRMIGHLALAHEILRAGDLVREYGRDQIFGLHAHELRRHLLVAAEPGQRKRDSRHPTPPRREHRCVEHGLDQQRPHACRMKITGNLGELKAVRRRERQHDIVLGRGSLELEVELAAEALAQRQPPGAVDATAERGMDDELHAACFVKEALQHDSVLGRQAAERGGAGGEIFISWSAAGSAMPIASVGQRRAMFPEGSDARRAAMSLRNRDTADDSSSVRPGASPSQNGIVGGCPWASSTRTVPRSTRPIR
jgi:hypothetical protein